MTWFAPESSESGTQGAFHLSHPMRGFVYNTSKHRCHSMKEGKIGGPGLTAALKAKAAQTHTLPVHFHLHALLLHLCC